MSEAYLEGMKTSLATPRRSFRKCLSEAYLEGMKTICIHAGGRIQRKSEAYLEGMKTRRKRFPRFPRPQSEAYLEGMKTRSGNRFLIFATAGPKPTSKE